MNNMKAAKKAMLGITLATVALSSATGDSLMPYTVDDGLKFSTSNRKAKVRGDGSAEYYLDEKGNIRRRRK